MRPCLVTGLLALALAGCDLFAPINSAAPQNGQTTDNTSPGPDDTPAANINGDWRFDGVGDLPGACVTIANSKIASIDFGCDSSPAVFLNDPGGYVSGNTVTLGVVISLAPDNGDSRYGILTFYLTSVDANTMSGSAIESIVPDELYINVEVTWRR